MAFSSGVMRYFYPRPPRGRRRENIQCEAKLLAISIHALREEGDAGPAFPRCRPAISIHALREEGDATVFASSAVKTYFYPRPPRGGRLLNQLAVIFGKNISIHALREEGDAWPLGHRPGRRNFYPRPPRGGRLNSFVEGFLKNIFLSTPSARRATEAFCCLCGAARISIHALREEGDR